MDTNPTPAVRLTKLVEFIFRVHEIATGQKLGDADALRYFQNPSALAEAVRSSGVLDDKEKARRLDDLLALYRQYVGPRHFRN